MIARFTTNSRDGEAAPRFPGARRLRSGEGQRPHGWKFGARVAIAVTDDRRRIDGGRFARRIELCPVRGGFQRPPQRRSFRRSLWPRSC